ncbi:MAG: hypothetical protein O2894_06320, partial [Planctomycetota bacterium]|nr:hypothetical protein [Planctomycetota bacterium]
LADTEHTIRLERPRTVRWPIAAGDPHAPPEGTVLTAEASPGAFAISLPTAVRVEDGHVVAEGCSPMHMHTLVQAPDGAYAHLFARMGEATGREVVFQRPRRVVVRLKTPDGAPATGWWVSARNQGNNVIVQPQALPETGELELDIRYEHLVDFFVARTQASYGGLAIGSLNLKTEGGTIEAELPSGRRVDLTIVIDGEARLPPSYAHPAGTLDVEEDPAAGVLHLRVHGRAEQELHFHAAEYLPEVIALGEADADGVTRARVVLRTGAYVLLHVRPPPDGHHRAQVVGVGASAMGFRVYSAGMVNTDLGARDGWLVRRLGPHEPGEYEVADAVNNARTPPFTLAMGDERVVHLDLSKAGLVRGRVDAPAGFDLRTARVALRHDGATGNEHPGLRQSNVRADGTFELRIAGDGPVVLEVTHPGLLPAPEGGVVEVKGAQEGVVLRLVEGASLAFRLEPVPPESRHAGEPLVGVLLYEGAAEGKPSRRVTCSRDGDTLVATGIPAGNWTVVIDPPNRAPVLLGERAITGRVELGPIATAAGARVRIRLQVPEGQDPPRIYAYARALTGPDHIRSINSRGEAEVVLEGLGPGRFEIVASSMRVMAGAGQAGIKDKIVIEGEGEVVVDMDLR